MALTRASPLRNVSAVLVISLMAYWAVLIYQLGPQWSAYEHYNYGWAVPFLCVYLGWKSRRRGPADVALASELPGKDSSSSHLSLASLSCVACALALMPIRLLHEANPVWRLTSWAWAIVLLVLTLSALYLAYGRQTVQRYWFPLAFFLVAIPWPTPIELGITQALMRLNAGATVEVLNVMGIPAFQRGNLIELGTGLVGIDEACSGIRSLQASIMISLFFGELYRLGFRKRFALCAVAVVFSFTFNVGRTTLLSWVADRQGVSSIAAWHDPAGATILIACFAVLWLASVLMIRKARQPPDHEPMIPALPRALSSQPAATVTLPRFRFLSTILLIWFFTIEVGTELWYRAHETQSTRPRWTIHWPTDYPGYKPVEFSRTVRGMLKFDKGQNGQWRSTDGSLWQIIHLCWNPGANVYERVKVSLAKSHNPEICLQASGMKLVSELSTVVVDVAENSKVHFRQFLFRVGNSPVHVFYSVSEFGGTGPTASLRESHRERVKAALAGSRNYGQQTLEVAISGLEDPDMAKSAFIREMHNLLRPVEQSRHSELAFSPCARIQSQRHLASIVVAN